MAVTRIKNNQITDSTIDANVKLVSYSITSQKLANNLTYGSDLTVSGNLTVNGTTTTIDTVNVAIQDPLLLLADNQTGSPALDIGFIGKRGTSQNVAFVWKEANTQFETVYTSSEVSNTTVSVTGYSDLKTFNFTAAGNTSIGANLLVVGTTELQGNVIGNVTTFIGNIVAGNISTGGQITATSNITGGNLTTAGTANVGNLSVTGTTTLSGNLSAGNLSTAGQINATGNITGGNLISNAGVVGSTLSVSGNANVGNLGTAGLITATGNITGGNVTTAGIANIGTLAVTGAATVATTLGVTGNITGGNVSTLGLANIANLLVTGAATVGTTLGVTGNITGGNISAGAGIISTTGNVNGGNVNTAVVRGATGITISSGSGDIGLQPAGNIVLSGKYINGVNQPVQDNDAASKIYVDNMVSTQLSYHTAVVAATTGTLDAATGGTVSYNNGTAGVGATLTTTGTFNLIDTANVQTAGTRILVKNEANAAWNGVYVYTSPTVITRSTDTDTYGPNSTTDLSINDYFFVQSGNVNKGSAYICDAPSGVITFGTSNITFAQFSSSQTYTANTAAGIVINGTVISSKTDDNTTAFDIGGNIIVKAGANLTTPNIGAATGTSLNVTGNITGGNLLTNGLAALGGSLSVQGNANVGNLGTAGLITATGNITGGNVTTAGIANIGTLAVTGTGSVTGNLTAGNVTTAGIANIGTLAVTGAATVGTTLGVTGNANVGNLGTAGLITATGNITGGNLTTAGIANVGTLAVTGAATVATTLGVTGNITGGNITTAGQANLGNIVISGDNITDTNGRVNFNSALGAVDFAVNGGTANVFYISASSNSASFGNATQVTNAVVAFNSANSIVMPTGNTLQRPGTGVTGMMRFNTSTNSLEYYDNSKWTSAGTTFTVIVSDQFTGNGAATTFTLSENSTTAGTIVAINGVVQIPTSAYSVTGNVLTFTEAPLSTDVIDARILTTTTTVTALQNATGTAIVEAVDGQATVSVTGNLLPTSNATFSLGNASSWWKSLYVAGNTIYLGNLQLKAVNGQMAFYAADGTTPATIASSSVDTTTIANGNSAVSVVTSGGNVRANINGATVQTLSTGGANITGYITATGNVTGNYILGNGSQLTGIDATSIQNGSANVRTFNNGNVTVSAAGTANVLVVTSTGANIAGTLNTGTGNANVGNIGATNGVFTSISGNLTGTLQTANQPNITTVGTLGSLAVSGNITPGGISMSTGNATIGNLYVSGQTTIAGNITQISGNSGQFFGNASTGFNALYAGLPAGFSLLPQSVVNFIGSYNDYVQINNQNTSAGNTATADYVITSNNGNDSTYYVDFGIASSTYDGAVAVLNNAMGNSVTANDAYLYVTGNVAAGNPSDMVIAAVDVGGQIRFPVGGSMAANVAMKLNAPNTTSSSTTTGTAIITGGLGVSGNITAGGHVGTMYTNSIINTGSNATGNIGSASTYFNTVFAKATSAQYADLAEYYESDATYEPGTVVMFGGSKEVTMAGTNASSVAGVISTNPSYIMNSGLEAEYTAIVALTGRVPTKVVGTVRKGDMMISAGDGRACACTSPQIGTVIGKALADFDGAEGVIEVVVGRL